MAAMDKPLGWAVRFLFRNMKLSLEFWTVIARMSDFRDQGHQLVTHVSITVDLSTTVDVKSRHLVKQ